MKVKARELKAGQMIRFEYGDYDNFVRGMVLSTEAGEIQTKINADLYGKKQELIFRSTELVEVVEA